MDSLKFEHCGVVTKVTSGDTLVVSNPKDSITIHLDSITAPRMPPYVDTTNNNGQPHALESREYLRLLCMGRQVNYKYTTINGHHYGWVKITDGPFQGTIVNIPVIQEGMGALRSSKQQTTDIYKILMKLDSEAREMRRGMWADNITVPKITKCIGDKSLSEAIFNSFKDCEIRGVVDMVRDGGSLKMLIPQEVAGSNILVLIMLSGIEPEPKTKDGEISPLAFESKAYLESLCLCKEVKLFPETLDTYGNFIGRVRTHQCDLAVEMLEKGYVKMSTNLLHVKDAKSLRAAQAKAQDKQLRCWNNFVIPEDSNKSCYVAKAVEIQSGDRFTVLVDNELRRLYLAAVRSPRLGGNNRPNDPFALEAREFVINEIASKEVTVRVEYTQSASVAKMPPSDKENDELHFVTVWYHSKTGKKNLSEELAKRGLVSILNRTPADQSILDRLIDAQIEANQAQKGIHGNNVCKQAAPRNDLTGPNNMNKAKAFENTLCRLGSIKASILYVHSASSYKLDIPCENLILTFCLSGVRAPGSSDEYYNESRMNAMQFMHSNVIIKVESVNKRGLILGSMYKDGIDVASTLVSDGVVRVVGRGNSSLKSLEERAIASRIGMWSIDSIFNETVTATDDSDLDTNLGLSVVVEISSWDEFYIQKESNERVITNIQDSLRTLPELTDDDKLTINDLSRNMLVICRFSDDGQLYRARIEAVDRSSGMIRVFYIDYGNKEQTTVNALRKLPLSLQKISPVALCCKLAGISSAGSMMDQDASSFFFELTRGVMVWARSVGRPVKGVLPIVVKVEGSSQTVQEKLLSEGLVRLKRNFRYELAEAFEAAAIAGRNERNGVYRMTTAIYETDEEDN